MSSTLTNLSTFSQPSSISTLSTSWSTWCLGWNFDIADASCSFASTCSWHCWQIHGVDYCCLHVVVHAAGEHESDWLLLVQRGGHLLPAVQQSSSGEAERNCQIQTQSRPLYYCYCVVGGWVDIGFLVGNLQKYWLKPKGQLKFPIQT